MLTALAELTAAAGILVGASNNKALPPPKPGTQCTWYGEKSGARIADWVVIQPRPRFGGIYHYSLQTMDATPKPNSSRYKIVMTSQVLRADRSEDIVQVTLVGWLYTDSDGDRYYQADRQHQIFEVDNGDVAVVQAMQRATPYVLVVWKDSKGKIIRRMEPFGVPTSIQIDRCFSRPRNPKD